MQKKYKEHSREYLGRARDYWWSRDYLALLARRLNLKNCRSLLDVGCGKGYMAFRLAPFLAAGAFVQGIDAEPAWIAEAEQIACSQGVKKKLTFRFSVGDACHLPCEESSMDVTCCQTLLLHLAEPGKAIEEMVRVTRPGGTVVAFEPNNRVHTVIQDNLEEPGREPEKTLRNVAVYLAIEQGKKALGEGFNSIGDQVPELFARAGLRGIRVWLCDKAASLVPPYDTPEKEARRDELLGWIRGGESAYDFEGNLRYFLAGGGSRADFDCYWKDQEAQKKRLEEALRSETYISAGGLLSYIVAGTKGEPLGLPGAADSPAIAYDCRSGGR